MWVPVLSEHGLHSGEMVFFGLKCCYSTAKRVVHLYLHIIGVGSVALAKMPRRPSELWEYMNVVDRAWDGLL